MFKIKRLLAIWMIQLLAVTPVYGSETETAFQMAQNTETQAFTDPAPDTQSFFGDTGSMTISPEFSKQFEEMQNLFENQDMTLDASGFSDEEINSLKTLGDVGPQLDMQPFETMSLEDMKASMEANSDSILMQRMGGDYVSLESPLFSLGNTNIDIKDLNVQYADMQLGYAEAGYGIDFDLKRFELKGFSQNSVEEFNKAFAGYDLGSRYQTYVMPEDFNMNSWLNSLSSKRNNSLSAFTGSDVYQTVHSKLSIGNIFARAAAGAAGVEELKSASGILNGLTLSSPLSSPFSVTSSVSLGKNLPKMDSGYKTQINSNSENYNEAVKNVGNASKGLFGAFNHDIIKPVGDTVTGFFKK